MIHNTFSIYSLINQKFKIKFINATVESISVLRDKLYITSNLALNVKKKNIRAMFDI